jgi:hypothetical protein
MSTEIQRTRFFANATLLMAILVLLSFPLTYYLPVVTRSHSFQLLLHPAIAVVLPLQLSSHWIARSASGNGIAPALLGSG